MSVTFRALPEAALPANAGPEGAFAVGSVLWQSSRGKLVCTVVAKATYELAPGVAAPLDVPLPLQEEEGYWDDDASKSVHVPSDLVPFKSAAEVVVVGSAFAPMERAASVTARIMIGSVDKAIEAFPPRQFRRDGAVETGPPLGRFSLRYEHAAKSADNPSGIDVSRVDMWGKRQIPELLPASFTLGVPNDHLPTVGFGPIASTWPRRAGRVGAPERAWLRHPTKSPAPETLARFFQAAPMDQWLDRALAANEQIVLEGLSAAHPRLVMSLSGIEPRALVVGVDREPLRLSGDLLFIDTDQCLCTLTFRGQIEIDEGARALSVIVVGAPMGATLSSASVLRILQENNDDDDLSWAPTSETSASPAPEEALSKLPRHILMALASAPPLDAAVDAAATLAPAGVHAKPALPFQRDGQRVAGGTPVGADLPAEPARRVLQINSAGNLVWTATSAPADLSADPSLPLDAAETLGPAAVHAKPALPFHASSPEPAGAASEAPPLTPGSASDWPVPPRGPLPPAMIGSIEPRHADAPPAWIVSPEQPDQPPMFGPIEPRGADASMAPALAAEEPAPPPMIGPIPLAPPSEPLATPDVPAPEASAPEPPPVEEPKAPGLPLDKYPLETCAAIAARIALRPEEEGAILEAEKLSKETWEEEGKLSKETWEALHTHWLDAIREDTTNGKRKLLSAYDVAYVGALEAERGPITPSEYARLVIAAERGQSEQMLTKLGLPEGVMMRIRRVWLERTVKDPKVAGEVRAAMRKETSG